MGDTYNGFVETRQDLIERGMTLGQVIANSVTLRNVHTTVLGTNQQNLIDNMRRSPIPEYNKLADISISLSNDAAKTAQIMRNQVLRAGTHAYASTFPMMEEGKDTWLGREKKFIHCLNRRD